MTTAGMRGGGYYDNHSEHQRDVAGTAAALIEESVAAIPLPAAGRAFTVADYGASTGRNSIASIGTAVAAVRRRRADAHLAVIHNDLPTNDWNQLFANVAASPEGASGAAGAVVPLASAVSFFEPAAPAGSVHLGLSFSAAHWLRSAPRVVVPDAFYFCEATAMRGPPSRRRPTPTGRASSPRARSTSRRAAGSSSRPSAPT